MAERRRFPEIVVSKNKGAGFEGLAGFKLKSLLVGELLNDRHNTQEDKPQSNSLGLKMFQASREKLLHAISSWPSSVSLEMRMSALPDLGYKAQGRIEFSLFLRVEASNSETAKEDIIRYYINLMPLLNACLPEAEFLPVTDVKELNQRIAPFAATHATALVRKRERFSLACPLKRVSIGFGPLEETSGDESNVIEHTFPWVPSMDDWLGLVDALLSQLDSIQVIVRIRPNADAGRVTSQLEEQIRSCEHFIESTSKSQTASKRQTTFVQKVAIKQLAGLRDNCFHLGVYVLAQKPIDSAIVNLLARSISGPQEISDEETLFQGRFASRNISVNEAMRRDFFPEDEPYTIQEAACAFRLPSPAMADHPGIPLKRARTAMAVLPPSSLNENDRHCIRLFVNEHQGAYQPVRVGADDRMRHCFILGQTGTGKTTLIQNMALQDMQAGRGLAVIDPHGEMVEFLLGRIPKERAEDVILFDPLDRERPLGYNLLEWKTEEERDFIIDELYTTMDRLYDMKETGGPIFESNFRGMLRLLMDGKSIKNFLPTILEFPNCYISDGFREWLKDNTQDPTSLDFVKELESTCGDWSINNLSQYFTSKFKRFTNDSILKMIFGQEKTTFDFPDIMNNGKILLMKLGKGRFGPNVSALLTNQIVSRFKQVTMKRGEMRPEDRRDFYMYIDECHNLPSDNFVELLSEARKYRMGLVLATQYASQLKNPMTKENDLLSAVLGNVGTIIMFRLGHEDSRLLADAVYPTFSSLDIAGLPNYQGYCRLQLTGEPTPALSFKTEQIETPYNDKIAQNIISLSRFKYGMDRTEVEAQIWKRRQIWR